MAGEAFNLASGQHRTIKSIASDVVELMNYPKEQVQMIGERPGQVLRHTGDYSKINRVLGWKPQVSWEEGLKRTIEWYRRTETSGPSSCSCARSRSSRRAASASITELGPFRVARPIRLRGLRESLAKPLEGGKCFHRATRK